MRSDKRTKGKLDWIKALLAAAALFGGALIIYPDAFADDPQIEELVAIIETQPARHRKLMALKELCDLDSAAARAAVIDLAESDDDAVAFAAITAMSREDFTGARDALEDIVDDSGRSYLVRRAALGACMQHRERSQGSWNTHKGWIRARSNGNTKMKQFAQAYAKSLWGSAVDDE